MTPPGLLDQWQRLILPPQGVTLRAGEQLRTGNSYPNAAHVDLKAHLDGRRTFAVNLAWPDPQGGPDLCRAAVLDVDEGAASLGKVRALAAVATAGGLSCLPAWSGSKGAHAWLFFAPAPVPLVRAVLAKLRAAVPFKGEAIPGDVARVKLPPAMHQTAQRWALWLDPLPDVPPDLAAASTGFLEAQAAILASVTVTPRATLERYAGQSQGAAHAPADEMAPDLGQLGATLAPCISALVGGGAQAALGAWDKNALTLARYCAAAGVPQDAAAALLRNLSDNTDLGFETSKDPDARLRHWQTIHDPGPFECGFVLKARRALGFDCGQCAARPAGVRVGRKREEQPRESAPGNEQRTQPGTSGTDAPAPLLLEPALADALVALALQTGQPSERINPAIFPRTAIAGTAPAPLHALAWAAMVSGHTTPAAALNWLDRQPDPPDAPTRAALADLVTRLLGLFPLADTEQAALLTRAADLSARLALLGALASGKLGTEDRRPLADVLGDLQTAALRLQQDTGAAWGAPLTAYAAELLEGLISTDRPTVPTPFETLNNLLGGGFQGGKLYGLVAPPGAGKSTFAAQCADHAATLKIPVCFCAMEMGRPQLFDYALSRRVGMNSAKIESRAYQISDRDRAMLATGARDYLETVAPWLTVLEGGWDTTAATLGAWVAQARARYGMADGSPVFVVVDYLQLLNTGNERLDSGADETPRISAVAVALKQFARDSGAAVLALSDITKGEQGDAIKRGQELTLNAFRGSNRVPHSIDSALALYSEASQADGGKAAADPWEMLAGKLQESPRAATFRRALDDLAHAHPVGGPGAAVHSRLELLKNRGGRGRGSQVLLYERAFHRFVGLSVPGQDEAEGRGVDPRDSGPRAYSAARPPSDTAQTAPQDPDAAWKAERARYEASGEQPPTDPETGEIDPGWQGPEWVRMKNEATRQKEARRKGKGGH